MDIIMQAYQLAEAVSSLTDHVRQFFYQVMLSGHTCPQCHGSLEMTEEHTARCRSCSFELDPTVAFQRCSCGSSLELRICRYRCRTCGSDVQSRFVFDGIVLDPAYFSQKMAESRQRRRELRERVRSVLADTRSEALVVPPADASQIADLANALDELTRTSEPEFVQLKESGFDLQHYQRHIQAHTRAIPICLSEIPPLSKDARKDKIWRFIAALFLAHAGVLRIWQQDQDIMVMQHETHTKG